jgi:hypothetical protein
VTSQPWQVPLSNIPLGNLRAQFFNNYRLFNDEGFLKRLRAWKPGEPIETPYITWHYWIDQFYTFMLQHAVVGLESYVPGALRFELGCRGMLKGDKLEYSRNPFSIPGKAGTAKRYYVLLPRLLEPSLGLDAAQPRLWERVRQFYESVRNPIFHGKQLDTHDPQYVREAFELLADVYAWVDAWHNPDDVIPGQGWFTKIRQT